MTSPTVVIEATGLGLRVTVEPFGDPWRKHFAQANRRRRLSKAAGYVCRVANLLGAEIEDRTGTFAPEDWADMAEELARERR